MSVYDDAAEKAVKQVIKQYFEHHPVLSDTSVAENLAGLLNSDNEKIRLGAIKMWLVLRQMKPKGEEEDVTSMEEILRAETEGKGKKDKSEEIIYVDDRQKEPLLTDRSGWSESCQPRSH